MTTTASNALKRIMNLFPFIAGKLLFSSSILTSVKNQESLTVNILGEVLMFYEHSNVKETTEVIFKLYLRRTCKLNSNKWI